MSKFLSSGILLACLAIVSPEQASYGQDLEPKKASDPKLPASEKKEAKKKPGHGKFTIGKDTTYITEEVDGNGYIDYGSALNRRMSEGVTTENNALILIWQAIGPHPEGLAMSPDYFKWLGINPPPEKGEYYVPLDSYIKIAPGKTPKEKGTALADRLRTTQRLWREDEDPAIANWLRDNEKPFALIIEASKRIGYFSPLVVKKEDHSPANLLEAQLPFLNPSREIAKGLAARAMLRLEGHPDDAWQDLLACHRLARLVGRGGTQIESMFGFGIQAVACRASLTFLDSQKPDANLLRSGLRELQELPPTLDIADKMDAADRFTMLSLILMIDREGSKSIPGVDELGKAEFMIDGTDWDPALRNVNQFFDRAVAVLREKDYEIRRKQAGELVFEVKMMKLDVAFSKGDPHLFDPQSGPQARGEAMGKVMLSLLVPAFDRSQAYADQSNQRMDNLVLAFALACYQREQGAYPKKLDALIPNYLQSIPNDLFAGRPLYYRTTEDGYLLSSVGPFYREPAAFAITSRYGLYLSLAVSILAFLCCLLSLKRRSRPIDATI